MCSGKTTLGKALSAALNCDFIDLDDYIEAKANMTIREIFANQGEEAFRQMEREALKETAALSDAVIACGGGTPCAPGAMALMNGAGTSVWLRPNMERLLSRLMDGREKRPLIANIQSEQEMIAFAQAKLNEREPYYSQAAHCFDSSWLEDEEEIADSVRKFCQKILPEDSLM